MKYAVVSYLGRQYKVSEGEIIDLDYIASASPASQITLGDVLLVVEDGKRTIGSPTIKAAKVSASVIEHKKGEKVRVGRYKAKVRSRKVQGFRSKFTTVKIEKISA